MSGVQSAVTILQVQAIEPCLGFWSSLGFTELARVPHGERLGFVLFGQGGAQVMLQSLDSLREDLPAIAPSAPVASLVYLRVHDLDATLAALADAEEVVPRRRTFYGAEEVFVRDPGGNLVGLSQHG